MTRRATHLGFRGLGVLGVVVIACVSAQAQEGPTLFFEESEAVRREREGPELEILERFSELGTQRVDERGTTRRGRDVSLGLGILLGELGAVSRTSGEYVVHSSPVSGQSGFFNLHVGLDAPGVAVTWQGLAARSGWAVSFGVVFGALTDTARFELVGRYVSPMAEVRTRAAFPLLATQGMDEALWLASGDAGAGDGRLRLRLRWPTRSGVVVEVQARFAVGGTTLRSSAGVSTDGIILVPELHVGIFFTHFELALSGALSASSHWPGELRLPLWVTLSGLFRFPGADQLGVGLFLRYAAPVSGPVIGWQGGLFLGVFL